MTALLRYDAACTAIAEAKAIDEVRDWEDKAAAVREYARRSKNRQLEIDAAEIRVRAQRRAGELLADLRRDGRLTEGRRRKTLDADRPLSEPVKLEDLGLTKDESSRDQKLAAIEPDAFECLVGRCRARMEQNPDKHAIDVLREQRTGGGPIAGARSVMSSRIEPVDSLDYFPTPPWATRTLMEVVLPAAGIRAVASAWEPACGDGLMAEVLREYVPMVLATDVHDYGYEGQDVVDFLAASDWPAAELIVTNPPFGDLTLPFVHQALVLSTRATAMFVRSQWAVEGVERYETLFRARPPTLLAPFVERVPLCKGRWDPEGSTATAYCWLVWVHGAAPRPPLWIPPGQRARLSRSGDAEHFTQQPVPRRAIDLPAPVDLGTGGIIESTADPAAADGKPAGSSCTERRPDGVSQSDTRCRISQGGPVVSQRPAHEPEDDGLDIPAFLDRRSQPAAEVTA